MAGKTHLLKGLCVPLESGAPMLATLVVELEKSINFPSVSISWQALVWNILSVQLHILVDVSQTLAMDFIKCLPHKDLSLHFQ